MLSGMVGIDEGEIVALMGPNGAGKSTILKQMLALARGLVSDPKVLLLAKVNGQRHFSAIAEKCP